MALARILGLHRCWPTRDIAILLGRSCPDLPVLWGLDPRYRDRPSEDLLDSRERELELTVLERKMRKKVDVCPTRRSVVEKDYLLSPECGWDSKPCENCQKPLQIKWSTCPYCATVREYQLGRRRRIRRWSRL
jgi:hypothetical protein